MLCAILQIDLWLYMLCAILQIAHYVNVRTLCERVSLHDLWLYTPCAILQIDLWLYMLCAILQIILFTESGCDTLVMPHPSEPVHIHYAIF